MASSHDAESEVRAALENLRTGYLSRDLTRLDSFMDLFVDSDEIEMIGVGAATRGGEEWFEGRSAVRGIVESDWTYWGDVDIDLASARISVTGGVAWLSVAATLTQTAAHDEAMPHYVGGMRALLDEESRDAASRMMEATYFGLARLRERHLGPGHRWPLVITAVLRAEPSGWRFHTLHWSTPP